LKISAGNLLLTLECFFGLTNSWWEEICNAKCI
jgi:hypothetical protein